MSGAGATAEVLGLTQRSRQLPAGGRAMVPVSASMEPLSPEEANKPTAPSSGGFKVSHCLLLPPVPGNANQRSLVGAQLPSTGVRKACSSSIRTSIRTQKELM